MKFIGKVLSLAMLLFALPFFALAQQNSWTKTTLSGAVNGCTAGASACQTVINLSSATNVNPPSNPVAISGLGAGTGSEFTFLYVDNEEMQVLGVNGTAIAVNRGYNGTKATAHNSGATVYLGPASWFGSTTQFGACSATSLKVLPYINATTGDIFQCYNSPAGQLWFQVGNGTSTFVGAPIGAPCSGTVGSAETEYLRYAACSGATTATLRSVITQAGSLANLQVYSSAAVTGGSSADVATVYKNGSSTALTCTIAAAGTTCSDSTHSVAVAAGDVITFQFVTATSDTAANITMSVLKY